MGPIICYWKDQPKIEASMNKWLERRKQFHDRNEFLNKQWEKIKEEAQAARNELWKEITTAVDDAMLLADGKKTSQVSICFDEDIKAIRYSEESHGFSVDKLRDLMAGL